MCCMQRPDRAWQTALQGVSIPGSRREGLHTNREAPSLEINQHIRWMLLPPWKQPSNESYQVSHQFSGDLSAQNNSGCNFSLISIGISKIDWCIYHKSIIASKVIITPISWPMTAALVLLQWSIENTTSQTLHHENVFLRPYKANLQKCIFLLKINMFGHSSILLAHCFVILAAFGNCSLVRLKWHFGIFCAHVAWQPRARTGEMILQRYSD